MNHKTLLAVMVLVAVSLLGLLALLVRPIAPALARWFEPWALDIEGMLVHYAVANTKSTAITNLDSTPAVMNSRHLDGALHELCGTVEIAAADCANSVYRMVRVHSSWRIADIIRYNDAITSGTDFDAGLYETAENGGAVKNVNCFADAVSLASASLTGTKDLFEAGADEGVEDLEKRVWEYAGDTSDPNKFYDLCYTGVAPGSGAGTLSVRVQVIKPGA